MRRLRHRLHEPELPHRALAARAAASLRAVAASLRRRDPAAEPVDAGWLTKPLEPLAEGAPLSVERLQRDFCAIDPASKLERRCVSIYTNRLRQARPDGGWWVVRLPRPWCPTPLADELLRVANVRTDGWRFGLGPAGAPMIEAAAASLEQEFALAPQPAR